MCRDKSLFLVKCHLCDNVGCRNPYLEICLTTSAVWLRTSDKGLRALAKRPKSSSKIKGLTLCLPYVSKATACHLRYRIEVLKIVRTIALEV